MTTTTHDVRLAPSRRYPALALVARVLDYLFGLLYSLLLVRLVLDLIGARRSTGFFQFIAALTRPFYGPFEGIVATETVDGIHPIVWPIVVAIVAYMLLHAAIRGLLRLAASARS